MPMPPAQKCISPLKFGRIVDALNSANEEFAKHCHISGDFTSKSWWLLSIAKLLGTQRLCIRTDVPVNDAPGHFIYAAKPGVDLAATPTLDLVACRAWGRIPFGDEHYGTDELYLPSFYIVQMRVNEFGHRPKFIEDWRQLERLVRSLRGPVTATLLWINNGHRHLHEVATAARDFPGAMADLKIEHAMSTGLMVPGIGAAATLINRRDEVQVLAASKVWDRVAVKNPLYDLNANDD